MPGKPPVGTKGIGRTEAPEDHDHYIGGGPSSRWIGKVSLAAIFISWSFLMWAVITSAPRCLS